VSKEKDAKPKFKFGASSGFFRVAPSLAVDLVYKAPLRRIRMNPAGRHPGRAARTAL
jgi:hypothetical protein